MSGLVAILVLSVQLEYVSAEFSPDFRLMRKDLS